MGWDGCEVEVVRKQNRIEALANVKNHGNHHNTHDKIFMSPYILPVLFPKPYVMAPIELDHYAPASAATASATSRTGEVDSTSDPLLRHARFASSPPDNDDDDDLDDARQTSTSTGYASWRRGNGRRRSGSTNSGTFSRNSRRFPLMLVGIIGVPVLLLSLIYGIIRGNAPDLLPDLHLTDILAPIKLTESLSRRCVCGTDEGKRDTEGKRVCEVYGKDGLLRSRLHEGTGNRIKDFVRFARTGKKFKVGIMGGSGESRVRPGSCLSEPTLMAIDPLDISIEQSRPVMDYT
jgi:hypothetical protein